MSPKLPSSAASKPVKRIISRSRSKAETWPVSFRLTKEQLDELKLHARLNHLSVTHVVKEAVERFLAETSRCPAPAVGSELPGVSVADLAELSYSYHAMALACKRFSEAESVEELIEANALHWDAQRRIAECPNSKPLRGLLRGLRAADKSMFTPMAGSNSPTCGQSNSSGQDGVHYQSVVVLTARREAASLSL